MELTSRQQEYLDSLDLSQTISEAQENDAKLVIAAFAFADAFSPEAQAALTRLTDRPSASHFATLFSGMTIGLFVERARSHDLSRPAEQQPSSSSEPGAMFENHPDWIELASRIEKGPDVALLQRHAQEALFRAIIKTSELVTEPGDLLLLADAYLSLGNTGTENVENGRS